MKTVAREETEGLENLPLKFEFLTNNESYELILVVSANLATHLSSFAFNIHRYLASFHFFPMLFPMYLFLL